MRQFSIAVLSGTLTFALAGCGHPAALAVAPVGAASGARGESELAIGSTAAKVAPDVTRLIAPNSSRVVAPNTSRVGAPVPTVSVSAAPMVDPQAALDVGPDDPPELVARQEIAVDPPSFKVSDHVPYGVVVAEKSAHTVTISWATEVPTRGLIEYGRSWGFEQHGYTDTYKDDVPSMFHKITLTGLRRFTGYEYRVTAVTALGLTFAETPRHVRTKFWAWR